MILLLEDDGALRFFLQRTIKEEFNCQVNAFSRIDLAKEFFFNNADSIECIIADLNMDDEFLGEYIKESEGGMLSGWVWIERFVYSRKPEMPIIICSGFGSEIVKDHIQKYINSGNKIVFIEKGIDGVEGVMTALRQLLFLNH